MKRKIILPLTACFVILVAVGVIFLIHDVRVAERKIFTQSCFHQVALSVEKYREVHGIYPTSIEQLASESDKEEATILNNELLTISKGGLKLEYQIQTNGFSLSMFGIDPWCPRLDKVEQNFQVGEALHIFNAPAKTTK